MSIKDVGTRMGSAPVLSRHYRVAVPSGSRHGACVQRGHYEGELDSQSQSYV